MPNRILKQSICTSPNLNILSTGAENFFYRLIVQCDDFGRYHANLSILRAHCYPLRLEIITDAMVGEWLAEILAADLAFIYGGGRYLAMRNWRKHQTQRATTSKFPEPTADEINCKQMQADAITCMQVQSDASNCKQMLPYSDSLTESNSGSNAGEETPPAPPAPPRSTKAASAAPPRTDLLVVNLPHGQELQATLDKHFGSKTRPRPAWNALASCEQADAYRAAAYVLDGDFIPLVIKGLGRERDSRSTLLAWLETCVKRQQQPADSAQARNSPRATRQQTVAEKLKEQDTWDWDKITGKDKVN